MKCSFDVPLVSTDKINSVPGCNTDTRYSHIAPDYCTD